MVDVYIHLRLVSLPLIYLAASSICNLYVAIFGLEKKNFGNCISVCIEVQVQELQNSDSIWIVDF